MASCSNINPPATATPTIIQSTNTPTATINWFPATNTPTPLSTNRPTPTTVLLPGLGTLIIHDAFVQADQWSTSAFIAGQGIVNNNSLTLAIPDVSQGASIISLLQGSLLSDFYTQVTVRLNLCKGRDQFGILFRASSPQDFYRFSVSCSSETRLEKVISGTSTVIRDWAPSPDGPLGAPGEITLGVSAIGQELMFYLDDRFQFQVFDMALAEGGLGVYLRASSDSPATVSFSDLEAYQVIPGSLATPQVEPTAQPTP